MGEKIKIIAGILFALAFIGVMGVILSQVNKYGENTSQGMSLNTSNSTKAELAPYNEQVVSGDTIIQLINNHSILSNGQKLVIVVSNSAIASPSSTVANSNLFGYCATSGTATINKNTINGVVVYYMSLNNQFNGLDYGSSFSVARSYNSSTSSFKIGVLSEYDSHLLYESSGNGVVGVLFIKK